MSRAHHHFLYLPLQEVLDPKGHIGTVIYRGEADESTASEPYYDVAYDHPPAILTWNERELKPVDTFDKTAKPTPNRSAWARLTDRLFFKAFRRMFGGAL